MALLKNNPLLLSVLPEDVVQGILLRLPVKSILRFKCVSKSWYSFLNCRKFNAKHLSIQSEDHLFIYVYSEQAMRLAAYSVSNIDDQYTYAELDMLSPYLNHVVDDPHCLSIKGPCDGLFVIADYAEGGDVVLCNIATRNFRTLPKSFFYPFAKNYSNDSIRDPVHAATGYVGIGYDSKVNDYKVLRILEIWNNEDQMYRLPPKAEVFSIGTDTCWREIDMTNLTYLNKPYCEGAFADGTLYGMMYDDSMMLTFDIVDERFQYIPMPEKRCAQTYDLFVPAVYDKKMALLDVRHLNSFEGDTWIDVWGMNKFKMEECWTKLFTFRLQTPIRGDDIMTFCKNGSEFVYVDINRQLRVYDLVNMKTKTISFEDYGRCYAAAPYMQTLVCIQPQEVDSRGN